ncbi:hypothetical protein LXL04_012270 [Taraxacum kok-saghyz]
MDEGMSGFGLKPTRGGSGAGGAKCGRWNPTNEQVKVLTDLFRSGLRTPSTDQIQKISSQLSFYGKIESKNVFYWFQNHKARERQKRRRVYVEYDQNDHNVAKQHFAEVTETEKVIETLQLFPVNSLAFDQEKGRVFTNDECKENTSPYTTSPNSSKNRHDAIKYTVHLLRELNLSSVSLAANNHRRSILYCPYLSCKKGGVKNPGFPYLSESKLNLTCVWDRCKLKTNDAAKEFEKMEEGGVVVPESVTEAVNRTSNNFQEFQTNFLDYLPLCDPDTLLEFDPLQLTAPKWTIDSWRSKKALQLPEYPDQSDLESVLQTLETFPPIVFAGEARSLEERLGEAAMGNAFLLQGGDCAESFKEFNASYIHDTFRVILQMGVVLIFGGQMPVIFTIKLRCNGVDSDDHPERLNMNQEKLDRSINLSKGEFSSNACEEEME